MANWNEFLSSAKKAFNKAAVKVNGFADSAADTIKIESIKLKLSEKYEQLGRLVYNEMKAEAGNPNAEKVAEKAAEIDALHDQINSLKARKNKRKSEKAEAKAQPEEAKEPLALPEASEEAQSEVEAETEVEVAAEADTTEKE